MKRINPNEDRSLFMPTCHGATSKRAALPPFKLDDLERRRLLSASIVNGILEVEGTTGNDTITVGVQNDGQLAVVVNADTSTFDPGEIDAIRIKGLAGNDSIRPSKALAIPMSLFGGDGNDT